MTGSLVNCRYGPNMVEAVEECNRLGFVRGCWCKGVEGDQSKVEIEVEGAWDRMQLEGVRLSLGGVRGVVRAVAAVLQILHDKGEAHGGIALTSFYKDGCGRVAICPPSDGSLPPTVDLRCLGELLTTLLMNLKGTPNPGPMQTAEQLLGPNPPSSSQLLDDTPWLQLPPSLYCKNIEGLKEEGKGGSGVKEEEYGSFAEGIRAVLRGLENVVKKEEEVCFDVSAITPTPTKREIEISSPEDYKKDRRAPSPTSLCSLPPADTPRLPRLQQSCALRSPLTDDDLTMPQCPEPFPHRALIDAYDSDSIYLTQQHYTPELPPQLSDSNRRAPPPRGFRMQPDLPSTKQCPLRDSSSRGFLSHDSWSSVGGGRKAAVDSTQQPEMHVTPEMPLKRSLAREAASEDSSRRGFHSHDSGSPRSSVGDAWVGNVHPRLCEEGQRATPNIPSTKQSSLRDSASRGFRSHDSGSPRSTMVHDAWADDEHAVPGYLAQQHHSPVGVSQERATPDLPSTRDGASQGFRSHGSGSPGSSVGGGRMEHSKAAMVHDAWEEEHLFAGYSTQPGAAEVQRRVTRGSPGSSVGGERKEHSKAAMVHDAWEEEHAFAGYSTQLGPAERRVKQGSPRSSVGGEMKEHSKTAMVHDAWEEEHSLFAGYSTQPGPAEEVQRRVTRESPGSSATRKEPVVHDAWGEEEVHAFAGYENGMWGPRTRLKAARIQRQLERMVRRTEMVGEAIRAEKELRGVDCSF